MNFLFAEMLGRSVYMYRDHILIVKKLRKIILLQLQKSIIDYEMKCSMLRESKQ